ncbi:hypothetical protein I6G66_11795 [Delftia acidovorans]|uniref:Uncharacterized protein n=1 Tax=Delftia acidovorans TaxID=80866 RepID=A0A7T2S831_DELAC|nr:hypothetical protein [Delftia acidovorans]QPS10623.1 hypothetical protein I6G66_11795 [Delftia acidovorans]
MKKIAIVIAATLAATANAAWQYQQQEDRMTSEKMQFAYIESNNSLNLPFPYAGKNHGTLTVRKQRKAGLEVYLSIEKGQIICPISSDCKIQVRFDDGKPMDFSGSPSADHDSTIVFLKDAQRFINAASKAKQILVQANIYQAGSPILEFHSGKPLESLEWTRKAVKSR